MTAGAPVIVDVVDPRLAPARAGDELRIRVDPVYGSVAVAAALDAGWDSVELAEFAEAHPPIPLVSFEQPPAAGQLRCRVRSRWAELGVEAGDLLGAPAFARPLSAMVAALVATRGATKVTFIPALADPTAGRADTERAPGITTAGWWAAGMLIRVLLEELDQPMTLTDAGGIVVTLATGAENARAQLSAGAHWREHEQAGGHLDDLRIASAVDSLGAVPLIELARDGERLIATRCPFPVVAEATPEPDQPGS